jgi:hypothetical protein
MLLAQVLLKREEWEARLQGRSPQAHGGAFYFSLAEIHCGTWTKEGINNLSKNILLQHSVFHKPQPVLSVLQMANFCILDDSF